MRIYLNYEICIKHRNLFPIFEQDTGYSGGKIADYTLNQEASGATLKYTRDQPIYMTERHDDYTFDYKIPVNAPGTYVLILKFSEV